MKRFARELSTRDGRICMACVCANRVLDARERDEATNQSEHAANAGNQLLHELSE